MICFGAKALTLDVVNTSFEEYVEINQSSQQYLDIKASGDHTGSDYLTIKIYHVDVSNGSLHNETTLLNEKYYQYFLPLEVSKVDGSRRIFITIPEDFRGGKFKITVSFNNENIYGLLKQTATGIIHPITGKEVEKIYYDFNGRLVENPTEGLYIVQEGDRIRKIYKTGN